MDDLPAFAANAALAAGLGTLIGFERHLRQHSAGMRTNALVALGAAMFVSLTRLVGDTTSPSRIASYIVSGVGFLGGGVILKEGTNVRGLTTAAGLWCSAAVGTLAGIGYGMHALVGTAFVLAVQLGLRLLAKWLDRALGVTTIAPAAYRLKVTCGEQDVLQVRALLASHLDAIPDLRVTSVSTSKAKRRKLAALTLNATAVHAEDRAIEDTVSRLLLEPGVRAASWEKVGPNPE
jgi:putative Mg2+ transporter-C (MgtC) family protein